MLAELLGGLLFNLGKHLAQRYIVHLWSANFRLETLTSVVPSIIIIPNYTPADTIDFHTVFSAC